MNLQFIKRSYVQRRVVQLVDVDGSRIRTIALSFFIAAANVAIAVSPDPVLVKSEHLVVGERHSAPSVAHPSPYLRAAKADLPANPGWSATRRVTVKCDELVPEAHEQMDVYVARDGDLTSEDEHWQIFDNAEPTEDGGFVFNAVPNLEYELIISFNDNTTKPIRDCNIQNWLYKKIPAEGDVIVDFHKEEAVHHYTFVPTAPDGSDFTFPKLKDDDSLDWTGANAGYTGMFTVLGPEKAGSWLVGTNSVWSFEDDRYVPWVYNSYYTNDFPEGWYISTFALLDNEEGDQYLVHAASPLKNADTRLTNTGDYLDYSEPSYHTPYYKPENVETYEGIYQFSLSVFGNVPNQTILGSYITPDRKYRKHVSSSPLFKDGKIMSDIMVQSCTFDETTWIRGTIIGDYLSSYQATWDQPVVQRNGEWEILHATHDANKYHWIYSVPEGFKTDEPSPNYPGHPAFSYPVAFRLEPVGSSAPVCALNTQKFDTPNGPFAVTTPLYLGIGGEMRLVDDAPLEVMVTADGEVVCKNYDQYVDIMQGRPIDAKGVKSKIHTVFTNTNIEVDGIPGSNVTEFAYDENSTDWWVPTLQMLHYRNDEGEITNRFERASDGILEFAGGDFSQGGDPDANELWYTETEAQVKVEYAPRGENEFSSLGVPEEIPEMYFMPGFGHFYRMSLDNVCRASADNWYDLRITMTDDAGNVMCQTISPAFKVEVPSGVDAVGRDITSFQVSGRNIIVPEGSVIFTMQGIMTDGRNLIPGIYIVKTPESTFRVMVK